MRFVKYILFLLILIVGVSFLFGFYSSKEHDGDVLFAVLPGEGVRSIGLKLYQENLIWHPYFFDIYALISGKGSQLKAGHYLIKEPMTVIDIINLFYSGDVVDQKITIVEGWNKNDIADYLSQTIDGFDKETFLSLVDSQHLEGYLFPDTYNIPYGYSEKDIIKVMLNNFNSKITEEMRRDMNGKSLSEIVTMASIIEKEVRSPEDKAIVSGILWKRIANGTPLQSCATIVYITGKKSVQVSNEETKIDSPYNTYLNRGLPIGPISNPGLESIKAAIYPKESEYFFYLSKPDGETVFSKTFDEHIQAKNKYLK